jgi:hypothetical protein
MADLFAIPDFWKKSGTSYGEAHEVTPDLFALRLIGMRFGATRVVELGRLML